MSFNDQLKMQRLGEAFDKIFRRHGVTSGFGVGDFIVTDTLVTDLMRTDARISDAIVDATWPHVATKRVVHYTRRSAAKRIIADRELRLYELFKRVSNHEMSDFFKHHGFKGALHSFSGVPTFHDQMKKIFYASFTSESLDSHEERAMWDEFAPSDTDVRLTFKVDATAPDFRRVRYAAAAKPGIPLILELQEASRQILNREFLFRGVTRVSAFYLRGSYSNEEEYRLLHARFDDDSAGVRVDDKNHRYISIPLNPSGRYGYCLTPVSIETRDGRDFELSPQFEGLNLRSE